MAITKNDLINYPLAYLKAIAFKLWYSKRRKDQRRKFLETLISTHTPNTTAQIHTNLDVILLLEKLPRQDKRIVKLIMKGYTQKEISRRCKCSVSTIFHKKMKFFSELRHIYSKGVK